VLLISYTHPCPCTLKLREEVKIIDQPEIHWEHGARIMHDLMREYYANNDPFNRPAAVLPQDPAHMPPSLKLGTREHANFLFATCYYMRGGVASDTAFKLLSQMYERNPEFFDPLWVKGRVVEKWAEFFFELPMEVLESGVKKVELYIEDFDEIVMSVVAEIGEALKAVGLNYRISTNPTFWVVNAFRLAEKYEGNAAAIFHGVTSWEEAKTRIRNDKQGGGFQGFQQKMVSMLAYYLMDAGFVSPFNFPIPVDIHVGRFTLQTEIVTVPGAGRDTNLAVDDPVFDTVREFYLWYATRFQVDPLHLCNAVWMYSRLKCAANPENETEIIGRRENRRTEVRQVNPDWHDPTVMNRWLGACGTCVFAPACKWNLASGFYYIHGTMHLRYPRTGPPPDVTLLSTEELVGHYQRPVAPARPQPSGSAASSEAAPATLFDTPD
jgi:hypothetical protein